MASSVPQKTAPKRRVLNKEEGEVSELRSIKRKAPTPIAAEKATRLKGRRQLIVVACILFTGISASAAVGYTDKGVIDVEETIAYRNEQMRASGNEGGIVQVQNTPQLPNGGLVGIDQSAPGITDPNAVDVPPAYPTPAEVSTTTTSTSSPQADSTEEKPPAESSLDETTEI
jgi:hypothetical protein